MRRRRFPESAVALLVFAAIAIIPAALSFNPYYLSILVSALVLGSVSIAWNVLAGLCGQVSFGHAGFFGVGAYASAVLVMQAGWSPYAAMAGAGLIGTAAGLAVGVPSFKLRGPYFALAILGFAEVLRLLTLNLDSITGGSQGIFNVPPPSPITFGGRTIEFAVSRTANFYFAALLMLAIYLGAVALRRSRIGVAMAAVEADEETATGIGINVLRTKTAALAVSAFCTAIMGAFYAHYVHFLAPDAAFDPSWSIMPIVGSLFGGMTTLIGPAVGSLVMAGLDEFLFKRFFETGHQLFFGLLLAFVIVWAPSGLLGKRLRAGRSRGGSHGPRPAADAALAGGNE